MLEYIEREALIEELEEELAFDTPMYTDEENKLINSGLKIAIKNVKRLPKADVAEVKHGKWIKDRNCYTCSECGFYYFANNSKSNYCSKCGAKMDKE